MAESGNNSSSALAKMLNQLNLPTLGLVLLMGGGNFFATHQTSDEQRQDIYRAIRQINDLHQSLNEFEDRQKDALARASQSLGNQTEMLKNQTRMLDNQAQMLQQIKKNE